MSDKTHPWIYVIVPAQSPSWVGGDTNYTSGQDLVFAAFCKDCRTYFTEVIPWRDGVIGTITPSTLPRTGCVAREEDEGFSSLPGINKDATS